MVRIAFDVTPDVMGEIERLRRESQASTRAELFRNALRVYAWLLKHQREGHQIIVRKGYDGPETMIELAPL